MLGFIVGTACLIGVIKLIRGRRHGYGHCGSPYGRGCGYTSHDRGPGDCGPGGGCGGGGWRRHHGPPWARHGYGRGDEGFRDGGWDRGGDEGGDDAGRGGPVLLRGLFERLQTTPGQERVIAEALRELRGAFKKAAEEKAKGANQVAEALRGEDFKVENMAEAFAHLDSSVDVVRDASFSALAKIHDALDEKQRRILADMVGRGGRALENLAEQA
jgi:hypothetical protein